MVSSVNGTANVMYDKNEAKVKKETPIKNEDANSVFFLSENVKSVVKNSRPAPKVENNIINSAETKISFIIGV